MKLLATRGQAATFPFKLTDGGALVNLSGHTLDFFLFGPGTEPLLVKKIGSGVEILDAPIGTFQVTLGANELPEPGIYAYELQPGPESHLPLTGSLVVADAEVES